MICLNKIRSLQKKRYKHLEAAAVLEIKLIKLIPQRGDLVIYDDGDQFELMILVSKRYDEDFLRYITIIEKDFQ